jgi:hypothetical protein
MAMSLISKVRFADPNGSETCPEIHEYISVMDTLKFTFFKLKEKNFVKRVKLL